VVTFNETIKSVQTTIEMEVLLLETYHAVCLFVFSFLFLSFSIKMVNNRIQCSRYLNKVEFAELGCVFLF